jgi:hypothetical protein
MLIVVLINLYFSIGFEYYNRTNIYNKHIVKPSNIGFLSSEKQNKLAFQFKSVVSTATQKPTKLPTMRPSRIPSQFYPSIFYASPTQDFTTTTSTVAPSPALPSNLTSSVPPATATPHFSAIASPESTFSIPTILPSTPFSRSVSTSQPTFSAPPFNAAVTTRVPTQTH